MKLRIDPLKVLAAVAVTLFTLECLDRLPVADTKGGEANGGE